MSRIVIFFNDKHNHNNIINFINLSFLFSLAFSLYSSSFFVFWLIQRLCQHPILVSLNCQRTPEIYEIVQIIKHQEGILDQIRLAMGNSSNN